MIVSSVFKKPFKIEYRKKKEEYLEHLKIWEKQMIESGNLDYDKKLPKYPKFDKSWNKYLENKLNLLEEQQKKALSSEKVNSKKNDTNKTKPKDSN